MSPFSTTPVLPVRPKTKNRNLPRPWEYPYGEFHNELTNLFQKFFGGFATPFEDDFGSMRVWDFDVIESDKEIFVRAELPGFDEKDLDVQVADNLLTIKAEKKEEGEYEKGYRSFRRTMPLPTGVDANKVYANYRNGVLELHIPRTEASKVKHIPIKV
jgi:HSP20 family protein